MTDPNEEAAESTLKRMEYYNQLFDHMTQERHEQGRTKYGEFTFLENDTGRMLMEELADAANYARYFFIKIGLLNDLLLQQAEGTVESDDENDLKIGIQSFVGTKEGWDKK